MKVGYSEFSFGHAFTENLVRSSPSGPAGAPIFPNLLQEAQLGFDVDINLPGCPLFFQYKLPEKLTRKSAPQCRLLGGGVPYFRVALTRNDLSGQHERLQDLETSFPGLVFYTTPFLESARHFDAAYTSADVHNQCALFSPIDIGSLPAKSSHTICYRAGLASAWVCSDPQQIRQRNFAEVRELVRSAFSRAAFESLHHAAGYLIARIREFSPEHLRIGEPALRAAIQVRRARTRPESGKNPDTEQTIENIVVAREMARIALGVDLALAQPRP